jgi:hypothetical protein
MFSAGITLLDKRFTQIGQIIRPLPPFALTVTYSLLMDKAASQAGNRSWT